MTNAFREALGVSLFGKLLCDHDGGFDSRESFCILTGRLLAKPCCNGRYECALIRSPLKPPARDCPDRERLRTMIEPRITEHRREHTRYVYAFACSLGKELSMLFWHLGSMRCAKCAIDYQLSTYGQRKCSSYPPVQCHFNLDFPRHTNVAPFQLRLHRNLGQICD